MTFSEVWEQKQDCTFHCLFNLKEKKKNLCKLICSFIGDYSTASFSDLNQRTGNVTFSAGREEKNMQVDGVKFKQTWERTNPCLEFSTGDVF